jgi:hypothetical protein
MSVFSGGLGAIACASFLPQDPEMVRWLAQQLAPAKRVTVQYGGHSTKRPTLLTSVTPANLSCLEKYHAAKPFVIFLPNPDPDPAASRGAFFAICPTPQIQSHVVAVWAPRALFFFSCVRALPPVILQIRK